MKYEIIIQMQTYKKVLSFLIQRDFSSFYKQSHVRVETVIWQEFSLVRSNLAKSAAFFAKVS